jgi:hypothetical protein
MNAYQRLMQQGQGGAVGTVEIVGDDAALVTEADKGVITYIDQGYKVADKTYVGLQAPATPAFAAAPAPDVTLTVPVVTPFKPIQMVIPSWVAPGLVVVGVQIGPTQLIDGNPMPADAWTEVSTINTFSWPTVEMSQSIIVVIRNRNAFAIDFFNMGFYGIRLRK